MKLALTLLSILIFSIGCGSSRNSVRGANWCDTDYVVSTYEVADSKSKTKLEDDTQLNLKEGDYALRELDVYFNDTNRDIRTHVKYTIAEDGTYQAKTQCIGSNSGQINPEMETYIFELDVFSLMKIDASGKSLLADATTKIEFSNTGLEDPIMKKPAYEVSNSAPAEKNLKDTFKSGFTNTEQYLFELDESYELQNKLNTSSISIQSRQRWAKKQ